MMNTSFRLHYTERLICIAECNCNTLPPFPFCGLDVPDSRLVENYKPVRVSIVDSSGVIGI